MSLLDELRNNIDPTDPPAEPAAVEETPAELLDAADGPSPAQRIAAAMRTGNLALVAKVRQELGR
jgi:hypothetical protein